MNDDVKKETEVKESPKKDALAELIIQYIPDADVSEEGIKESAVMLIQRLGSIQDKLTDTVTHYPEFGEALNAIIKGMSPQEAIARYIDVMDAPEGSPDFDAISKAREERAKEIESKKAEREAREAKLKENEEISIKNFQEFKEETGMSDEDAQAFLDKLEALQADMFDGHLTPEHIQTLWKGFQYDDKIKEVEVTAKVAGRNEQIDKKIKEAETTDGLPHLKSSASKQKEGPKSFAAKFIEDL